VTGPDDPACCGGAGLGHREERFQIVLTNEIRRHGVSFEAGRLRKGVADGALEFVIRESATIGGAEEPPVGSETSGGKFDELAVVFFGAEDLAFVVAGEGGRIEDDAVEGAALAGEASEPVKGVALAEVMAIRIDLIEAHIVASPIEIGLREIEGGGDCSAQGGADGKGPGVGKGIEDGVSSLGSLAHSLTIVTLIEEEALGVAGLKTHLVAHAVFEDGEGLTLGHS
jgi:hypothetical protein